jgi:cobalt-zinc-cadmium resistance protein CzcA
MADAAAGAALCRAALGSLCAQGLVFGLAGAALVLAGVAYSVTGKTFLPTMDEGSVIVQLTKAPSISLTHSLEDDLKVQRLCWPRCPR